MSAEINGNSVAFSIITEKEKLTDKEHLQWVVKEFISGRDTSNLMLTGLFSAWIARKHFDGAFDALPAGSKITSIIQMFSGCTALERVPDFDKSNITNASKAFQNCKALKESPAFTGGLLKTTTDMFNSCEGLITVNEINMIAATGVGYMFSYCTNLTNLRLTNLKKSLTIGSGTTYGHLLTVDSLVQVISELINTGTSSTLTVGSANLEKLANVYVKLKDDDGSGKLPFEVCESTDTGAMLITEYVTQKNWALA